MKLIIPGEPIAQTRMKYSSRGGFGRIYDPRAKEKNALKILLKELYQDVMLEHPHLSFVFHMPIPKSIPKKLLEEYESGFLKHEKKPDVDNFVKLYLDCLDGIVFDGDQKVCLGPCVKLYHRQPETIVFVYESTPTLRFPEVGSEIWFGLCE